MVNPLPNRWHERMVDNGANCQNLVSDCRMSGGVYQVKRIAVVALGTLALILPNGAIAAGPDRTVETREVTFVLTSETCPHLADGTVIEGTGTERSSTTETTSRAGITTISNHTRTPGTATDQDGNTYQFLYLNSFRISNTLENPDVFSGLMHDLFVLHDHGPARLVNGFTAVFTTDFATLTTFDPIAQFGDPLNFATGESRCDPL
jgi:hypothetical protein